MADERETQASWVGVPQLHRHRMGYVAKVLTPFYHLGFLLANGVSMSVLRIQRHDEDVVARLRKHDPRTMCYRSIQSNWC